MSREQIKPNVRLLGHTRTGRVVFVGKRPKLSQDVSDISRRLSYALLTSSTDASSSRVLRSPRLCREATAVLRRLRLPIIKPYRLSYRTFDDFEPFVVEVEAADGRLAFGDGHISPGSSSETRAGGWDFLVRHLADLPGADTRTAKKRVLGEFEHCEVAATACATVIEVL